MSPKKQQEFCFFFVVTASCLFLQRLFKAPSSVFVDSLISFHDLKSWKIFSGTFRTDRFFLSFQKHGKIQGCVIINTVRFFLQQQKSHPKTFCCKMRIYCGCAETLPKFSSHGFWCTKCQHDNSIVISSTQKPYCLGKVNCHFLLQVH